MLSFSYRCGHTFTPLLLQLTPLYCPHTINQLNTLVSLEGCSKFFLEVGIYECGCTLHLTHPGSSFVQVTQESWTRRGICFLLSLWEADIFRFDRRILMFI